ncbi:DUF4245 family protein [Leucobacter denitrificans]|uniref:DUF4245 domain-containing protein n=1 Tax=Leucobacter denitrificans TaxID=683042 RepID=A0A7G9S6X6_9MICO|nr:DUF4245 family protein [Leucobacter denitrificans]QNN63601.1 DUF4245 domain-containing protein [Leucobacter denitrificans]
MAKKQPNIVAELGRPETASETAARKAENSRLYRQRKTVNNLVFSLLVTVGLVFVIYLMVPRAAGDFEDRSVDVAALAERAGADRELAVPDMPDTWKAKQATLTSGDDGVSYWQIHYTTENESYATVVQAFREDGEPVEPEWIAAKLEDQDPTGSEQLGGVNWVVYDHPERRADQVNMRFGLEGEIDENTLLVFGTDDGGTIRVLATQVAASFAGGDPSGAEGAQ